MARFTVVAVLLLLFVVALTKAQSEQAGSANSQTNDQANKNSDDAKGGAASSGSAAESNGDGAKGQSQDGAQSSGAAASGTAESGRRKRSLVHHLVARDVAEHHSGGRHFSDTGYPRCGFQEEEYNFRRGGGSTRGGFFP